MAGDDLKFNSNFYLSFHVRCPSCNNCLGHLEDDYIRLILTGLSIEDTLNQLNLTRICCRTTMMNPSKIYFDNQNRKMVDGDFSKFENRSKDYFLTATSLPERKYTEDDDLNKISQEIDLPSMIGVPENRFVQGFPNTYISLVSGKETDDPPKSGPYVQKTTGSIFLTS